MPLTARQASVSRSMARPTPARSSPTTSVPGSPAPVSRVMENEESSAPYTNGMCRVW